MSKRGVEGDVTTVEHAVEHAVGYKAVVVLIESIYDAVC